MASGLLIKQKQLLAGDGIAIDHGETASTISLAENALENAVRIYDATVEEETGVVTITDGTQVADLAIGDEIRTPDGVYQKIKDNITTTGSADGTRIEVSGITNPADANGHYALQSENVWKHESANYWITVFFSSGYYWMISNKSNPANPSESLFYDFTGAGEPGNPWDPTNWESMPISSGTPVLKNVASEQTVTDAIDLFEYASLPVEPKNIVQSVNGNKPDAGGNVTIEIDAQTRADEQATASSLTPDTHRYTVKGANTASISVVDDTGKIVMPDLYQVGDDVEIDFTNFSVGATPWTIQFSTGQRGRQGSSAYQSWLNTGHEGTESDFLEWLRGEAAKYPFTSSNLAGTILTLNTNSIITGVIDDSGKQWNLEDESVVYGDGAVTVELAGVMARKRVATISGTWKIALYGSAIN